MHLRNGIAGALLSIARPGPRGGSPSRFSVRRLILYDQERMNEFQLYLTSDRPTEQGYRTILVAPHHKPYDAFLPAPGHGLGFNDLKIINAGTADAPCRQAARIIDFDEGLEIERTVHAMARSSRKSAGWT